MEKNIAKSPEMIKKEADVQSLQKQLKKRKTVLKSLKTRLLNTKTNIEDVQRDVQSNLFTKMMEMDNLRVEISKLATDFQKSDGISTEDKRALGEMANELMEEDLFGEGFSDYKEQREKMERGEFEFEENFRAKMNDAYEEFRVKPEEKEQRNIRSVFLKLSKKFHPDLARNEQEEQQFHSLMQQINEAYKGNDVQTLLELEQMYLVEELDISGRSITIDVLDEEIKRLNRDLEFIEGQIERTSAEVKNLRSSEMGQMLTSMNKAEREGEGVDRMVQELNGGIEMMTKLRDGLKDSIERNAISPILVELMNPFAGTPLEKLNLSPDMSPEEMMKAMMNGIMKGDIDPNEIMSEIIGNKGGGGMMDMFGGGFDIFGDDDDDMFGREEVEDPTFPEGSSVRVTRAISHPELKKLKMKGWTGRVIGAFYGEEEEEIYEIEWDSQTLKKIPKKLIIDLTMNDDTFHWNQIPFKALEACEPSDTEEETTITFRTLSHQNRWKYLDAPQAKRLEKILLKFPQASDEGNWYNYLIHEMKFPFDAKKLGHLTGETSKVKVEGIAFVSDEYGLIMNIKKGNKKDTYPLMDLEVTKKTSKNYVIVEDYLEWADECLDPNIY